MERGPLRSRQISRVLGKKSSWKQVADQLVGRKMVRRASVLDPASCAAEADSLRPARCLEYRGQIAAAAGLGRKSKLADVLLAMFALDDPLPARSRCFALNQYKSDTISTRWWTLVWFRELREKCWSSRRVDEIGVEMRNMRVSSVACRYRSLRLKKRSTSLVALGLVRIEEQPE